MSTLNTDEARAHVEALSDACARPPTSAAQALVWLYAAETFDAARVLLVRVKQLEAALALRPPVPRAPFYMPVWRCVQDPAARRAGHGNWDGSAHEYVCDLDCTLPTEVCVAQGSACKEPCATCGYPEGFAAVHGEAAIADARKRRAAREG